MKTCIKSLKQKICPSLIFLNWRFGWFLVVVVVVGGGGGGGGGSSSFFFFFADSIYYIIISVFNDCIITCHLFTVISLTIAHAHALVIVFSSLKVTFSSVSSASCDNFCFTTTCIHGSEQSPVQEQLGCMYTGLLYPAEEERTDHVPPRVSPRHHDPKLVARRRLRGRWTM